MVTGSAGGRCLLADGVRRSVESPKSKNPKHLVCIGETSEVLTNETVKSVIRKVRRSLADVES
ncbi:MAG: hypothetical protein IJL66_03945 [Lachnospiraceae bacterium]|nr:hypothetical protein [Lachnospiraceae bacterium]